MATYSSIGSTRTSPGSLHKCTYLFFASLTLVALLLPLSPYLYTAGSNLLPTEFPTKDQALKEKDAGNKGGKTNLIGVALDMGGCRQNRAKDGSANPGCDLAEGVIKNATKKLGDLVPGIGDSGTPEDSNGNAESTTTAPRTSDPNKVVMDVLPFYKASCWCPAHFELHQNAYITDVCAQAFNNVIRGKGFRSHKTSVRLRDHVALIRDTTNLTMTSFNNTVKAIIKSSVYRNREHILHRSYTLTVGSAALVLFVFTVLLLIPDAFWILASRGPSRLNPDKTVDQLRLGQFLDQHARQLLVTDVARETAGARASWNLASLFLACKLLCCAVSIGEYLYTALWLLPQLHSLSENLADLSQIATGSFLHMNYSTSECTISIQQGYEMKEYDITCAYSPIPIEDRVSPLDGAFQLPAAQITVSFYASLFVFVSAFLVVHASSNILGTVGWVSRLCCVSVPSVTPGLSKDVDFLLFVIREKLGHAVMGELRKELSDME